MPQAAEKGTRSGIHLRSCFVTAAERRLSEFREESAATSAKQAVGERRPVLEPKRSRQPKKTVAAAETCAGMQVERRSRAGGGTPPAGERAVRKLWRRLCEVRGAWLLWVLVVSLTAGCGGPQPDPEARKVAEWVLSVGGKLQVSGRPDVVKTKAQLPTGDFAILKIDLSRCRVKNTDLAKLITLKNLQSLNLYQTDISSQALQYVVRLESLRELELSYTMVDDRGLEKLAKLKNLERVYVTGTPVTEKGIDRLKHLRPDVKVIKLE